MLRISKLRVLTCTWAVGGWNGSGARSSPAARNESPAPRVGDSFRTAPRPAFDLLFEARSLDFARSGRPRGVGAAWLALPGGESLGSEAKVGETNGGLNGLLESLNEPSKIPALAGDFPGAPWNCPKPPAFASRAGGRDLEPLSLSRSPPAWALSKDELGGEKACAVAAASPPTSAFCGVVLLLLLVERQ